MYKTLAAFALTLGLCAGLVSVAVAADRDPIAGRTQPVQNTTGKTVKIGLISFPESNEFFSSVKVGSDAAADVLKKFNAQVDYVTVNDFTQDAVKANVKVAAFITTADCAKDSGALFFHGEDLETAWGPVAVGAAVKAVNADPMWAGKDCKAGIITGAFSVPTHETMRKAILAGLKGTNISPVSDGVEVEQDLSKVGPAVKAYITGDPTDLCAIFVDIGDAGAAAAALTDEQAKHIKVISADFTQGGVEQLKKGKQAVLIGQDPFGEAYDTAILLYNAVVSGQNPDFHQPVKNSVMTPDNIDALMKAQADGTAP